MDKFLEKLGCVVSEADTSLYLRKTDSYFVFMTVYVSEIILFSNKEQGLDFVIGLFQKKFEIRITKKLKIV